MFSCDMSISTLSCFEFRCVNGCEIFSFPIQELVHGHTSMATDYSNELDEWASSDYYDEHVHKIQLPYAQVKQT